MSKRKPPMNWVAVELGYHNPDEAYVSGAVGPFDHEEAAREYVEAFGVPDQWDWTVLPIWTPDEG